MRQMSSTTSARCGSTSASSAPHWPCLRELEPRAEHGGVGADEGVALAADDLRRHRLAFELGQLRLVVEQVELAGRPGHEQVDDAPWPSAAKCGVLRRERVRRPARPRAAERLGQQRRQRDLADADAAVAEEVAAGDAERASIGSMSSAHSFVTVSSRFSTARASGRPARPARPRLHRAGRRRQLGQRRASLSANALPLGLVEAARAVASSSARRRPDQAAAEQARAAFASAGPVAAASLPAERLGRLDERPRR